PLVGRLWPEVVAAAHRLAQHNDHVSPPIRLGTMGEVENPLALGILLVMAPGVIVSVFSSARRSLEAAPRGAAAGARYHPPAPRAVPDELREAVGHTGITLREPRPGTPGGPDVYREPHAWMVAAAVGEPARMTPAEGDVEGAIDEQLSLVLRGHPLAAGDRRV